MRKKIKVVEIFENEDCKYGSIIVEKNPLKEKKKKNGDNDDMLKMADIVLKMADFVLKSIQETEKMRNRWKAAEKRCLNLERINANLKTKELSEKH